MKRFVFDFVLLPLLAISLPCTVTGAATRPVYDMDGDELSSASEYYVLPVAEHGARGGILGARKSEYEECPLFLVQAPAPGAEDTLGLVRFTPRDNSTAAGASAVRLSSDVTIAFTRLYTWCMETPSWYVTSRPPTLSPSAPPLQYVAVGNPAHGGSPPSSVVFRVEEHDDGAATSKGYKLVSSAGEGLGLYASSKDRSWLSVRGESPLVVVFQKGHA